MFKHFVTIYNQGCSSDERWNNALQIVSQERIWEALLKKLPSLDQNTYHFALVEPESLTIDELIKAIRHFVIQEDFYKELYSKKDSDTKYADLIDIAKLIALYHGERNYHRFLLPDNIQEDDISYVNKLYTMKHADLCAIQSIQRTVVEGRIQFDLLTFADIMSNFQQTSRLENFYAREALQPDQTIDHPNCLPLHRNLYIRYTSFMSGTLSKSAFAALKEFSELVSSEFDASHNIQGFFYRRRVNAKYNALQNLLAFIESLPIAERNALYAIKINSSNTFKSQLDRVLAEDCISQFADDITKILYQCDNTIRFTNPRPNQIIERQRQSLVLKGTVLDTDAEDLSFLRNLQKVIINTHYKVKIGTKVTLDGKTNWVPGSVAGIFHKCEDGIARRVTPGEARYQTVKAASEASRNPHHNSILLFLLLLILNIRDKTTDNFYAMVFDRRCSQIIEENDSLDKHEAFTVGLRN